jgi:hypothetical protein
MWWLGPRLPLHPARRAYRLAWSRFFPEIWLLTEQSVGKGEHSFGDMPMHCEFGDAHAGSDFAMRKPIQLAKHNRFPHTLWQTIQGGLQ